MINTAKKSAKEEDYDAAQPWAAIALAEAAVKQADMLEMIADSLGRLELCSSEGSFAVHVQNQIERM